MSFSRTDLYTSLVLVNTKRPCCSLILQREMGMIVHCVASAGQGCEASACHPLLWEGGNIGETE